MPSAGSFREPGSPVHERWITFGGATQQIAQDTFFDAGAQTIAVVSISSAEAFSLVGADQQIVLGFTAGIASLEAFSALVIDQFPAPATITSGEAFGAFQFNQEITFLSGIGTNEVFGIVVGDAVFTPTEIVPAEAFGGVGIAFSITPLSIDPTEGFSPLIVDQFVSGQIASGEAFGVVDLLCMIAPASIASEEAFDHPAATMEIGGGGTGAGGVLPLGDIFDEAFGAPIVQLPDRGPVPAGVAPGLDNTDPYGIDLELTPNGDLALRNRGDLARIGGALNCAQALVLRLRAYPGELPLHLDYGSLLADQLVGLKQLDVQLARSTANSQARQIIEHDRRFLAIKNVTAAFAGPSRVAVGLTLRLAGGEIVALDDLAETRIDEVTVDATSQLDTDLDLAALDAGLIDYDRDDLGELVDVDLLTGISS